MISLRKDTSGQVINFSIKDEQTNKAVNLTSSSIVAKQYSFGTNHFITSNSCVIVDAPNGTGYYTLNNENTENIGMYYIILDIEYENGNKMYKTNESLEIYGEQENIITPKDLISFIQIPIENAKSFDLIKQDLEFAESQLDLEFPSLRNTTNIEQIKLKRYLILIKSAISYFMTMDEGNVSPDRRINKIKEWERVYNNLVETLGDTMEGDSLSIRLISKKYSDKRSWMYGGDEW